MYPITWKPSPNFYSGRSGHDIIAIVNHRMVGFLNGTDTWFSNPANQVATHFGVGFRKLGVVEISQYVDLSDSAWHAGNYDPSGGWPLVKKTTSGAVINPNFYTIGIEHEDGGPNGTGIVDPRVKEASAWLQSIIMTGNIELMRSVGIRIRRDGTAEQIVAITPHKETIIDHNRIAGRLKPTCWRPWLQDTGGFPEWQPTLIATLETSEMAIQDTLDLLESQITELQTQRDTAVAQKDAAVQQAAAAEAKVQSAKASATVIQAETNKILSL